MPEQPNEASSKLEGASPFGFVDHPLRRSVLNEIHARPFQLVTTPRRVLHYAFATDAAQADRARGRLREYCSDRRVDAGPLDSNHHVLDLGDARLRWETHSEFTTYTWDMAPDADHAPSFKELLGTDSGQPGPLLVATRIDLVDDRREIDQLLEGLDPGSTAVSSLREGRAIGATDFQLHEDGMTRILLVDRGMFKHEIGPMVVRLTELETYRTLALFGLPEARSLEPLLSRAQAGLQRATNEIGAASGVKENRELLETLTSLAGELEAAAAHSSFRFGATGAYNEIVQMRLTSIRETSLEGYTRWSSFLQRRMAPAIRTGLLVEARLADLTERLSRAGNLLRTRIEVDLEQQNRELLASMDNRARLQLRLQQWVEGLSIAAVSYYVVSLISYLAYGADSFGVGINAAGVTALAVTPVALGIWLFVRSIRARGHAEEHQEGQDHS